ncbi:MAG: SRPBCC family protein [Candidatus Omnitrophica bacterium]|nr:SRPBCC family protein [Candidatus Omnitrophota bacterium]
MGSIQKQLWFNAPLNKVWDIWVDVEKTPEWVEGVQESRITSAVRSGRGLSWNEKCEFGKKVIQMDHEITEWEEGKKTAIHSGLPMGGSMDRSAQFKATDQGTQVDLMLEWDLGMVGAFFDEGKLQHMMEKSFNATAEKWKARAESPA